MSKSWISELRQYTVTRLLAPHILALWALLAATTWFSTPNTLWSITFSSSVLGCLLIQFRLWDDLVDVEQDRDAHPDRVLVHSVHMDKFWKLAAAFALGNVVVVGCARPWPAFASLMVSMTLTHCWYQFPMRREWAILNYHALLLKYPVFLFVVGCTVSFSSGPSLLLGMVIVYLAICVYEVVTDSSLRSLTRARVVAGLETVLLFATLYFRVPLLGT